jgi:hypothetical protein
MRALMKTALIAGVTLTVGIAGIGEAAADVKGGTPTQQWVYQPTATGQCEAQVNLNASTVAAANAAEGVFINSSSGFDCAFELERATWDGYKWFYSPIGSWVEESTVLTNNAPNHITGWYADGSGYRVEACFYMFDTATNWTGETHCTNGI